MKTTTIWVTAAPGRTLFWPAGVPNTSGKLAAGEVARVDLGAMDANAAARLRAFLRKRELAGDVVVSTSEPRNMAAPRPSPATTTAKE